jgi:hypothetical protein
MDLCADLPEEYGVEITKQGIHDRSNAGAVLFFNQVPSHLLSAEFNGPKDIVVLSRFNRVRIKDSTKSRTLKRSVKKGLFLSTDFPPRHPYMPVKIRPDPYISGNTMKGSENIHCPL